MFPASHSAKHYNLTSSTVTQIIHSNLEAITIKCAKHRGRKRPARTRRVAAVVKGGTCDESACQLLGIDSWLPSSARCCTTCLCLSQPSLAAEAETVKLEQNYRDNRITQSWLRRSEQERENRVKQGDISKSNKEMLNPLGCWCIPITRPIAENYVFALPAWGRCLPCLV